MVSWWCFHIYAYSILFPVVLRAMNLKPWISYVIIMRVFKFQRSSSVMDVCFPLKLSFLKTLFSSQFSRPYVQYPIMFLNVQWNNRFPVNSARGLYLFFSFFGLFDFFDDHLNMVPKDFPMVGWRLQDPFNLQAIFGLGKAYAADEQWERCCNVSWVGRCEFRNAPVMVVSSPGKPREHG